jgi:hypothetical protein
MTPIPGPRELRETASLCCRVIAALTAPPGMAQGGSVGTVVGGEEP